MLFLLANYVWSLACTLHVLPHLIFVHVYIDEFTLQKFALSDQVFFIWFALGQVRSYAVFICNLQAFMSRLLSLITYVFETLKLL